MEIKIVSSLEKICGPYLESLKEITFITALPGETVSLQFAVNTEEIPIYAQPELVSQFGDATRLYAVKNVIMDFAKADDAKDDRNYLSDESGVMPDLLLPISKQNGYVMPQNKCIVVWCEINIPKDIKSGEYDVTAIMKCRHIGEPERGFELRKTVTVSVLSQELPQQSTVFTQWFHADCIADVHQVPIYSEEHWVLIEKYIKMAAELGINMLLTPVLTPPLDTAVGWQRPCIQLVQIEKIGEKFIFDFSLLKRWITIALKNGIQYFEVSHLFSQWGLEYSPNIRVKENGAEQLLFGWHVKASDVRYKQFLSQFLPALLEFLKAEGIDKQCVFHISDEPSIQHLPAYKAAYDIVKPLLGEVAHMDAVSDIDFYETGLIEMPVCASDKIDAFIEKQVENLWVYYCCVQGSKVGNRYLSMPSYRNRILGLQMYKYKIKGFLQWGYNFYYSRYSLYKINPYATTSADGAFPSGDSFSVYPGEDGPLKSLRAVVFKEALQDIEVCKLLEQYIGHEKVVELIEKEAGMEITFSEYPQSNEFIVSLMEKVKQMIQSYQAC